MNIFKSVLEWWRLITATIMTLPFMAWSSNINEWLKNFPNPWLAILFGILFVGSFISIVYLLKIKSENSNKLVLKHGVYWDKEKNAYCPICKNPVVYDNWGMADAYDQWGYHCYSCKHTHELRDVSGNVIRLEQILSD